MERSRFLGLCLVCVTFLMGLPACDRSTELRLKLAPGQTFSYDCTQDLNVTISMMGAEQTMPSNTRSSFAYEVQSVDSAGKASVKVKTDLSALAGPQAGMMDQFLGASAAADVSEIELTADIAPDGAVSNVKGMEAIAEKIAESVKQELEKQLQNISPQMAIMMGGNMGQIDGMMDGLIQGVKKGLSNEVMQQQLYSLSDFYPPAAVDVGSTWTKRLQRPLPLPMQIDATYKVTQRHGGVLVIDYQGTITTGANSRMDMGALSLDAKLSGSQSGTIQVYEKNGLVRSAVINVKSEGGLKAGPMDMPLRAEGSIRIDGPVS